MTANHRKYPRLELSRSVNIMLPLRCELSDVSRRGARLTVDGAAAIPERFVVEIRDDLHQWCEVVWRSATQVGVKYIHAPAEFDSEMLQAQAALAEFERLEAARATLARDGTSADGQQAILGVAKDMRICRVPAIAAVAESLCKLIEHGLLIGRVPSCLVNHHVDAVGAIIREYTRADHLDVARELAAELRRQTDAFVAPQDADASTLTAA